VARLGDTFVLAAGDRGPEVSACAARLAGRPGSRLAFAAVQALTLARLPLAAAFAAVLLAAGPDLGVVWACAAILAVSELSDLFDGVAARRLGVSSELGAALDPYVDSVSRLTVFWAESCAGLVSGAVPFAMALRDVTAAYARLAMNRKGRSVSARWSGKAKAVVQGTGVIAACLGPAYWARTGTWTVSAISWAVISVTALSAVDYALAAARPAERVT